MSVQAEFVWHKLSVDNMDLDFVERRRVGLENFLLRVASHPVLSNDKILYHFLTKVNQSWVSAVEQNIAYCKCPQMMDRGLVLEQKEVLSESRLFVTYTINIFLCVSGARLEGDGVWDRISDQGT